MTAPVIRPVEQRGIVQPLRRAKDDFVSAVGDDLFFSNVEQVLGTRCDDGVEGGTVGELAWDPDFGSLFYKLRHQNVVEVLDYQARAYAIEALSRWIPDATVKSVTVALENRRLVVRVTVSRQRGGRVVERVVDVEVLKGT